MSGDGTRHWNVAGVSDVATKLAMLEDELLYGCSFYQMVNGRKARIAPDKVRIDPLSGACSAAPGALDLGPIERG